jgi:hypothetical protein
MMLAYHLHQIIQFHYLVNFSNPFIWQMSEVTYQKDLPFWICELFGHAVLSRSLCFRMTTLP